YGIDRRIPNLYRIVHSDRGQHGEPGWPRSILTVLFGVFVPDGVYVFEDGVRLRAGLDSVRHRRSDYDGAAQNIRPLGVLRRGIDYGRTIFRSRSRPLRS